MTKEDIFKNFLKDPLLVENDYISEDDVDSLEFIQPSKHPMIEVMKIAIRGVVDKETKNSITRNLNRLLNIRD